MSVFAHVDGLGERVEACIADSILAWRKEFKPGRQTVDTLAEHLYEVTTSLTLRPAGVALVTVEVRGRGYLEASVQCFRLKRKRGGVWVIGASSLDRK